MESDIPNLVLYVPVAHRVHTEIPVAELYDPVGQREHVETLTPVPVL